MAKSSSKRKKNSKRESRCKCRPIAKQPAVEVLPAEVEIKEEPDDQMESEDFLFKAKFLSYRYYVLICDKKIFNRDLKNLLQSYDQVAKESFLLNIYQQCYSLFLYKNYYGVNKLWEKTNEMYQKCLTQPIVQLDCIESKLNVLPTENVPKSAEMYIKQEKKHRKKKKGKKVDEVSRMILDCLRELQEEKIKQEIEEESEKEEILEECPNADVLNPSISPITVVKQSNGGFTIKKNNENTIDNCIQFNEWDKLIGGIFNDKKDIENYKQLFEDIVDLIFKSDAVITEPPSVARLSLIFNEEDVLHKYNPLYPCMILKISKSVIIRECLINLIEELNSKKLNLIFLSICFSKMYHKIKGVDNSVENFHKFCTILKLYFRTIDKWFTKHLMNKDYASFLILCDYIIGGDNSWMFSRQETKDCDTLTECIRKAYKYYEYAKHINYDISCWAISLKYS